MVCGPDKKTTLVTAVVRRLLLSLLRVVRGSVRVGLLLLPSCFFPIRQFPSVVRLEDSLIAGVVRVLAMSLTLLSGGAVWGGSRGAVAAATAIGLAVPLLGHAVGLLGCAAVAAHLLLAAIAATAVAAASATAAAAAAGTGVGGLVDADGPSVEPGRTVRTVVRGRIGQGCTYSMLFMAWMAFWASSSLL